MGYALDLDQVIHRAGDRQELEVCCAKGEPAFEGVNPLRVDVDESAVDLQPIPARANLRDVQPIRPRPVAKLDRATDGVVGPWSAAAGGADEGTPVHFLLGVVDVDGHAKQSDVGIATRSIGQRGADALEPTDVRRTGDDVRTAEQV